MAAVVVRVNDSLTIRMRSRAANLRPVLRASMGRAAEEMAGRIVETELSATSSGRRPGGFRRGDVALASRTGGLRRATRGGLEEGDALAAFVGVLKESGGAEKYAGILERGGTIRPTAGHQYLTIPIGDGLTDSGVARYRSPRDVREGGFFFRSRNGRNLFFARQVGKRAPEILFWLTREVTMPAKHWLSRGAKKHIDGFVEQVNEDVEGAMKNPT